MWTDESRSRIAKLEKRSKRDPSDLTGEAWERIVPLLPSCRDEAVTSPWEASSCDA